MAGEKSRVTLTFDKGTVPDSEVREFASEVGGLIFSQTTGLVDFIEVVIIDIGVPNHLNFTVVLNLPGVGAKINFKPGLMYSGTITTAERSVLLFRVDNEASPLGWLYLPLLEAEGLAFAIFAGLRVLLRLEAKKLQISASKLEEFAHAAHVLGYEYELSINAFLAEEFGKKFAGTLGKVNPTPLTLPGVEELRNLMREVRGRQERPSEQDHEEWRQQVEALKEERASGFDELMSPAPHWDQR